MSTLADAHFTWTEFYTEFADKLLAFKDNRRELVDKVMETYSLAQRKCPKLESNGRPDDIDPLTVLSLFNRKLTDENRKKMLLAVAQVFEVSAPIPDDFDGIPTPSNFNVTYYAFSDDKRRQDGDIDRLWAYYEAALAYANQPTSENLDAFSDAYEDIRNQYNIKWNVTMALYWARPFDFLSLDERNRWFLCLPDKMPQSISDDVHAFKDNPPAPEKYVAFCSEVLAAIKSGIYGYEDFPELSYTAWILSEEVNKKAKKKPSREDGLGDADISSRNYWLYAPGEQASMWEDFRDKSLMAIRWGELGNLSSYKSKDDLKKTYRDIHGNDMGPLDACAVWQFVNEIKPDDIIYAKRGSREIVGRGIVTGEYTFDSESDEFPNLRSVDWSHSGSWRPDLGKKLPVKTLTKKTGDTAFIAKVEALFDDVDEGDLEEEAAGSVELPPYSKKDFLDNVYMSEADYDMLTGVLEAKKNIILQGAPGVGKTYIAKRLAYSMMGVKDPSRVTMVQFHQSYSYEDFIEGYRPSKDNFVLADGSFNSFCKIAREYEDEEAAEDQDEKYFFIIDEINRGNISKIFGELFMLIESDKRGSHNRLQLPYSNDQFYVPRNLYIIGLMNTADRSLALIDYALRRRFAFFDIKPAFTSKGFVEHMSKFNSPKLNRLIEEVKGLNKEISEDDTLGEGFCIGHSYFCALDPDRFSDSDLTAIVEYELVPMLKEYWFDDRTKVEEWSGRLREAVK